MRPFNFFFRMIAGSRIVFLAALFALPFTFTAPPPAYALTIPCIGSFPPGCPITVPSPLPCMPIPPFNIPFIGAVRFPPGCVGTGIPCIAPGVPPLCSGASPVSLPCIFVGFPPGCTGTPYLTSYPCAPGMAPPFPPGCTAIPLPRIPCIAAGTPPGCTGSPLLPPGLPIPCISPGVPTSCTPIPLSFFPCVAPNTPPGCTTIPLPCVSPGVPVGCIPIPIPCITPGNPPGCTALPTPCISPGIPPGCANPPRPCIGVNSAGNNVPAGCFGTPPVTSCDPEALDAIEAKGYIEAQREIMQNQNLILRPDSVMEYTCIDALQYNIAAGVNFSEIGWIGAFNQLGIFALDLAVMNTSMRTLVNMTTLPPTGYLIQNFAHPLLDGRMGLTEYFLPSIPFVFYDWQPYTCDYMQRVWDVAKCSNFFDEDNHDAFYDFDWYALNDPRTYLTQLGWNQANSCTVINLAQGQIPKLNPITVGIASNWKTGSHVLAPENPWPSDTTPYADDPVDPAAYMDIIMPVGTAQPVSGGNVTCAPAIETGICVNRPGIGPYMDAVCPNPGCHYDVPATGGTGCTYNAAGIASGDVFNCVP